MSVAKRQRSGKESKSYYFKYKGRYVNTGFSDRRLAEQEEVRLRKKFEEEEHGIFTTTYKEYQNSKLEDNLKDYLQALAKDLDGSKQCSMVRSRILILKKDLKWTLIRDINTNSFVQWRTNNKRAPKTLNEFLSAINGFLNWMVDAGRLEKNHMKNVKRLSTKNSETFKRRALTLDEIKRLLVVAGKRRIVYLLAIYTGLRRNELKQLKWSDVHFGDDGRCSIVLRPETTKNGEGGILPVHTGLAEALKIHRSSQKPESPFVLNRLVARIESHKLLLKKVGIPYVDDDGRRADFHALRTTYNSMMGDVGIDNTKRMMLMRHNDPKLTTKTYNDQSVISLDDDIQRLPWVETEDSEWTPKRTHFVQKRGEKVRNSEKNSFLEDLFQLLDKHGLINEKGVFELVNKWYPERVSNPHSLARIGF